ncbi:MAG TPA: recombinase family protein [Vicinamibacterales bacterium]|nr:recombinase family protein [Vicinamibacterales bacterium]
MRAAVYARVSTADQHTENQLQEMHRYCAARGWTIVSEWTDNGVSGAKQSRPALDGMLRDAKRRRFDVVIVWSLDRLGRNLKHLITLLDEFQALGIAFISLREGLDWTTPAGRLQAQLLGMISEFERARIAERVRVGMARAKASGTHVGRPVNVVTDDAVASVAHLSVRQAAAALGVSKSLVANRRKLSTRVA